MDTVEGFKFERSKTGNDMIISNGSKGSVTIKNFLNPNNGAEVLFNGDNLKEIAVLTVGDEHFAPSTGKASNKYTGTSIADVVDASGYYNPSYSSNLGVTIDTGAGADSITGSVSNDKLTGGAGNDTIIGNCGADTIIGGLGDDILDAEYSYGTKFVFNLGDGNDTITATSSWSTDTAVFNNGTNVEVGYN